MASEGMKKAWTTLDSMDQEPEGRASLSVHPGEPENAEPVDADLLPGAGKSDYVMDRVDWYKELLREDPSSVLFCELAEELCAGGLWQEAIKTLRDGLSYHPRHIRGHALLGWALWEYGSGEQAEYVLNQARKELEKSAVMYRVLGEITTHLGDMEEANRFGTIYSLMRKGMDEPEVQWLPVFIPAAEGDTRVQGEAEGPSVRSSDREPAESRLLNFLDALMNRTRTTGVLEAHNVAVFTSEDREALKKLIHAHTGGL